MTQDFPRFVPISDHAVLVEFADEISDDAARSILALDRDLANDPPEGMEDVVPALVNLLVEFDPLKTDHETITEHLKARVARAAGSAVAPQRHEVLVCYDAPYAPDLEAVSAATGLPPDAVIACHLGGEYRVGMYGFAPGYAYLTGVDPAIQVPRKPAAIRDVPAGSVIIAGPQCLVTTLKMPTGWSVIGRSPTAILRKESDRPFLFDVGDQVRFRRIGRDEYEKMTDAEGEETHG